MLRLASILLLLCTTSAAQVLTTELSGTVTPAIAAPGQTVTLTVTALQNIQFQDSCILRDVRVGGPNGTMLPTGVFCLQVITPLNAGQTAFQSWTVPATTTTMPGMYWMRVRYFANNGVREEYFCFEVRYPSSPGITLAAVTAAQVGQPLVMSLGAFNAGTAPYITAVSLTSRNGIPVQTVLACLDQDWLLDLAWPNPAPGLFVNLQGNLDATGNANAITVNIPNDPALVNWPLKAQSGLLSAIGLQLSNPLTFVVGP